MVGRTEAGETAPSLKGCIYATLHNCCHAGIFRLKKETVNLNSDVYSLIYIYIFFGGRGVIPAACRISRARDQILAIAVTRATVVTTPGHYPLCHQGTPFSEFLNLAN